MIRKMIEESIFVISDNNEINLGYENGWSSKTLNLYKELKQFIVTGSAKSMNIGRCVNSYQFDAECSGEVFRVLMAVDSSD